VVGCDSNVPMGKDAIGPNVLRTVNAMDGSIFLRVASLALHLVGILHGARDRFCEGINEHSTAK